MSDYTTLQARRALFAMRMSGSRPDHRWVETISGCGKCPAQSPFRQEPGAHLYVIEEEPS